jgi:hypothetical protein
VKGWEEGKEEGRRRLYVRNELGEFESAGICVLI